MKSWYWSALMMLVLVLTNGVSAGDGKDWKPVYGSISIEYRWRPGIGCYGRTMQFRNNSKKLISFDYTVWIEGENTPQKGSTDVSANSTREDVIGGEGCKRVERVDVTEKN